MKTVSRIAVRASAREAFSELFSRPCAATMAKENWEIAGEWLKEKTSTGMMRATAPTTRQSLLPTSMKEAISQRGMR
ncbi:hypothetical protein [Corynebacterium jeddahense]|uniref:hypothetical protein n=1 Tax=Corynebacterium jeddahense TaxID=1414719 RepID=UPI0018DC0E12|nr:hypothetical protein [Corynebacterium jeddahense]